ncbi:unnamed protein product [Ectocarpus sp. 6 AP-2014]
MWTRWIKSSELGCDGLCSSRQPTPDGDLTRPVPAQIATWDLTDCGIGDAGLTSLLPAWWRIFSYIAPVRELRLSGNHLGQAGLAPFFNMLNGTGFAFPPPDGLSVPPGPLPAPNTSFVTCLELGGCDLRGAFPSLGMLLLRCPFLRRLGLSNPLPGQGVAFGLQEAEGVFGALVNSLCPLEELDMRGQWGLGAHGTMNSASCLAGLVARKPTLSRLLVGEVDFNSSKTTELDIPAVAASVSSWGADVAADRSSHTVDLSNCLLQNWPPVGPTAPGALTLKSCGVSWPWYQGKSLPFTVPTLRCFRYCRHISAGLLLFCTTPHSTLRRLDISFRQPAMKQSLAVALGHLVATSPLEALVMPGDFRSNGVNCLPGDMMAAFFLALGLSKTLLELDVTGHQFGDVGCVPLGNALRQNRSITTLSYDHNWVTLEGFKAIRGCLYGNKKLVKVSAPAADLAMRTSYLQNEVLEGQRRMWEIKARIKAAYKYNKPEFHRQIALISANNKAWKALEREKNKTIEVAGIIADCIESNRQLKDAKDAGKWAAKKERQQGAFEERYATKMGKILTKLSKETDKARLQAASTKTSPFKAKPRTYFYSSNAQKQQEWRQRNNHHHHHHHHGYGGGMYFVALPSGHHSPYHHDDGCRDNLGGVGGREGGGGDTADHRDLPANGEGSASISPEEELVDLKDDYVASPGGDDGESSNPLDRVRDLITNEGPSVFDPSNLGRIDDLFREAGSDVYERMGPILGEAGDFGSKVADTAASWGTDLGSVFGSIGESAGDAFGGLGDLFSDVGGALGSGLGDVGDWAGDALGDGLDAARGLAEDIGEGIGDGLDAAGDLAGDGLDVAGDLAEDIGEGIGEGLDAAGDLAADGLDAAGDLAEDIGEGMGDGLETAGDLAGGAADAIMDAVDGVADDVDMYAGAGPRDLDDEGPTGDGNFAKVLAGPRRLVKPFSVQRGTDSESPQLMGVGEWTASRLKARADSRRVHEWAHKGALWEERMLARAKELDRPGAFPYKMRLHAFHAGRAVPSPESRVTLVTQCSTDRLPAVLEQALRWGGDISLAVHVPSAPLSAKDETMSEIRRLCQRVDQEVRAAPNRRKQLSVDVAILEGAEADPARHDHCGPLYPVNTLRNLALIQARDDSLHPAQAVFLVDCDCLPSEHLLEELHSQEVQDRLNAESSARPAAVVIPCLEFAPGSVSARHDKSIPSSVQRVIEMLAEGTAQGFHVDYFFKGHGPTDFLRWAAAAAAEESKCENALAYTVPFESCFEPYVVVNKTAVQMYDERFRGYGMNKARAMASNRKRPHVAHLLSLASGSPSTDTTPAVRSAEFVVLRKGFVFARPHERSPGWEETYGSQGDPCRRYQIKDLWSKFQGEIAKGLPPVVCSSTAEIAASLQCYQGHNYLGQLPPSFRVCRSLVANGLNEGVEPAPGPMPSEGSPTRDTQRAATTQHRHQEGSADRSQGAGACAPGVRSSRAGEEKHQLENSTKVIITASAIYPYRPEGVVHKEPVRMGMMAPVANVTSHIA